MYSSNYLSNLQLGNISMTQINCLGLRSFTSFHLSLWEGTVELAKYTEQINALHVGI